MSNNKAMLKSIGIRGFRGFNDLTNINFDSPIVFLFGRNGVGKSSTLESIEWGLYGDISDIMFKRFITRTKDELINVFEKEVYVKILLSVNGQEIPIERTKNRKKTKTTINIPNVNEENLEYYIHRITGLSFSDFIRAVFLHQESIRSLLIEDTDRDKAIDRLFGLEILSNILDSIPIQKINEVEKDISNKIDNLQSQLRARIDEIDKQIKNNIKDSRKRGIQDKDINITYLETAFSEILKIFGQLSKELGIEKISITIPQSLEEFEDYLSFFEEQIRKIRRKIETKEAIEIREKLNRIADLKADYSSLLSKREILEKDLNKAIKGYGTEDVLKKEIENKEKSVEKLEKEIENLKNSMSQLNSKFVVVKDAIKYLKDVTTEVCPICSKKFQRNKILKHLENEYQKYKDKEIEKIDKKIEERNHTIESLNEEVANINRVLDEIEDKKEDIERVNSEIKNLIIEDVSKELEKALTLDDDINSILDNKIKELKKEIEKYNKPIEERERKLEAVEDMKTKMSIVCNILLGKKRLENFEKINRNGFKEITKIFDETTNIKNTLDVISDCIREVQVSQSSDTLKKSLPLIQEYYKKLVNHPFYSSIEIERETVRRGGKIRNKYYIKCFNPKNKEETGASQRLSTGQMNCVAIAIYLALAKLETMSHNLGFLLMDDPAQSLDTEHKKALADILKEIAKEKQLIIATHDVEFQGILKENFKTLNPMIYEFHNWQEKGPDMRLVK